MLNTRYLTIACCLLILTLLQTTAGADAGATTRVREPLRVFVSILPTQYFVQRIGGDRVAAESLVKPGYSPETYSPTPQQMAQLASSRIYFRIGLPFENALLPKLERSFPQLSVVDLQEGISLTRLEEHNDEDGHGHKGGELDPHTWLDPMLALAQARIIRDTLSKIDPEGGRDFDTNFQKLSAELEDLDRYLRETLAPYKNSTVYVFHPAYGYFCRAYGLRQKAITPGGKEPGAKYIATLIDDAKRERVRVIFVQPQFSDKAAKTIARAIDGSVVALDPLAYDYITNLKNMADKIVQSLH